MADGPSGGTCPDGVPRSDADTRPCGMPSSGSGSALMLQAAHTDTRHDHAPSSRAEHPGVSVPQRVVERSVLTPPVDPGPDARSTRAAFSDHQLRPTCSGSPNTDRNNASCGCPKATPSPPPVMAHRTTGSDITHEAVQCCRSITHSKWKIGANTTPIFHLDVWVRYGLDVSVRVLASYCLLLLKSDASSLLWLETWDGPT